MSPLLSPSPSHPYPCPHPCPRPIAVPVPIAPSPSPRLSPSRCLAGIVSKQWQPWLVGLTAVVVFLFIVFVALLANRFWQLRMRRKRGAPEEPQAIGRLEKAAYSNAAADRDSDDEQERHKATSL
ncbi:small integral membrane protein 24 [Cygnus olor]|uniref:small integral membrane protein 24 n=1 Tax=Cygnus olor TaxID=8869 RepID=UPI001ADE55B1|nr:small integral membrane protein 24 [Cygnus olor]